MITRENVKELLPIIKAFAEGKPIQDKIEGVTDWVDTDEINLEYEGQKIKHRIKPEPKYRPFKNQEECWNEMLKHQPFGWIIDKVDNKYCDISMIYHFIEVKSEVKIIIVGKAYTLKEAFNNLTFTDGTPFGVKVE